MGDKKTQEIGKGKAGPGRPKGMPNKITALLKDDILQAAQDAHPKGRVGYLTQQAQENPTAFLTLLGKVLPMQVEGTGEGGALNIVVRQFTVE
jgi:stalled ribosome alternative rescue factor ArfA